MQLMVTFSQRYFLRNFSLSYSWVVLKLSARLRLRNLRSILLQAAVAMRCQVPGPTQIGRISAHYANYMALLLCSAQPAVSPVA